MIQAKVVSNIKFPELTTQDMLTEIAEKIIIPDMAAGIHARKAIVGGSLPKNEPETIKRKRNDRPLIETGKLIGSFTHKASGKNKVIIRIKGDRNRIGGYLQNDGIVTKDHGIKFYRFFGISKDAHKRAMAYARNKIKEITRGRR